jgi:ATP synthase
VRAGNTGVVIGAVRLLRVRFEAVENSHVVFFRWGNRCGRPVRTQKRGHYAPLLNLTPEVLLSELTADYLLAQLCSAALNAFAAENAAQMTAMEAARHQVERQLASLQATERHVRQAEITAEIIEPAAGETASHPVCN